MVWNPDSFDFKKEEATAHQNAEDIIENALAPMLEAAIICHELFTNFVEAGFTEDQALKLVSYAIKGSIDETQAN